MKKLLVLLFLTNILCWSCKKESETGKISFLTSFAKLSDTISYDSVSFMEIKYSELSDIKDTAEYNNPNIYSKSMRLKVDKSEKKNFHFSSEFLDFNDGEHYIIKSFELTDNAGKVIYYIPYVTPSEYLENFGYTIINLPIPFSAAKNQKTSFDLTVIKK